MIGSGKNRYQLFDVEDLCDAIYLCATLEKEKVNDTFNVGAKDYTTMGEDYQAVLDYAGFKKKISAFSRLADDMDTESFGVFQTLAAL